MGKHPICSLELNSQIEFLLKSPMTGLPASANGGPWWQLAMYGGVREVANVWRSPGQQHIYNETTCCRMGLVSTFFFDSFEIPYLLSWSKKIRGSENITNNFAITLSLQ